MYKCVVIFFVFASMIYAGEPVGQGIADRESNRHQERDRAHLQAIRDAQPDVRLRVETVHPHGDDTSIIILEDLPKNNP